MPRRGAPTAIDVKHVKAAGRRPGHAAPTMSIAQHQRVQPGRASINAFVAHAASNVMFCRSAYVDAHATVSDCRLLRGDRLYAILEIYCFDDITELLIITTCAGRFIIYMRHSFMP